MLQDVRHWGQSEEPGSLVYVLFDEWSIYFGRYYVAARVFPGLQVAPELRQAIWAVDPEIPMDEMLTMRQRVTDSVAEPRFYSVLFVVFAGVALLLAAGGIYGSLSTR